MILTTKRFNFFHSFTLMVTQVTASTDAFIYTALY